MAVCVMRHASGRGGQHLPVALYAISGARRVRKTIEANLRGIMMSLGGSPCRYSAYSDMYYRPPLLRRYSDRRLAPWELVRAIRLCPSAESTKNSP